MSSINAERHGTVSMEAIQMVKELEQTGQFRVLKRVVPLAHIAEPVGEVKIGVIVDTEAEGLSTETDGILQFSAIRFEFCEKVGPTRVLSTYDCYQDLKRPIAPEVTALTGITNEMVSGKKLDRAAASEIFDGAYVIIAHKADFDRKMLERQFPYLSEFLWACSLEQVPWKEYGIGSSKLDYLLFQMGYFYAPHSAMEDCWALLTLLSQKNWKDVNLFSVLLENCERPMFRLMTVGNTYNAKEMLSARQYQWRDHGAPFGKCWARDLPESGLVKEMEWLSEKVYGKPVEMPYIALDPMKRFSVRE